MAAKIPLLIANRFHPETIEKLDQQYQTHKLWEVEESKQAALVDSLKDSCRAVATASWATNPLIYQLPKLEIIACFGVGTDGIDFGITRNRGIDVTNTPSVLNDAVADVAMALILATQRRICEADRFVREGQWLNGPLPFGNSLAGRTLGIVGLGAIGEEIATRAQTFKMKIAYHNRNAKSVDYTYCTSLEELAEMSDILLCMLPGGAETDSLINTTVLQKLGPKGTFINVGRGTAVDETALIAALENGTIAGAGLDVYRKEPHVPKALLGMKNVVLLPHIGSATVETRRAMGQLVIDNLEAWSKGKALLTVVS